MIKKIYVLKLVQCYPLTSVARIFFFFYLFAPTYVEKFMGIFITLHFSGNGWYIKPLKVTQSDFGYRVTLSAPARNLWAHVKEIKVMEKSS